MDTLEQANKRLQARSQSVWNHYVGGSRLREVAAWVVATIGVTSGCIGIAMAAHYANTIAYVREINSVDKFGQLLSRRAQVLRATDDALARNTARTLVLDIFTIEDSKLAMQVNAQDAQARICSPAAHSAMVGYWAQTSPLQADGSWNPPQAERGVNITSILRRPGNHYEYLVQFTTQDRDTSGGVPAQPKLYQADIAVEASGVVSDENIGGYCAVHLDYTEIH